MRVCWARVVFARLIVDGKQYGVKSFLVQLRDPTTFDLKPGVSIGDCGAKMVRPDAHHPHPFIHTHIHEHEPKDTHTQIRSYNHVTLHKHA
jgi:acyl-CoA oxidase